MTRFASVRKDAAVFRAFLALVAVTCLATVFFGAEPLYADCVESAPVATLQLTEPTQESALVTLATTYSFPDSVGNHLLIMGLDTQEINRLPLQPADQSGTWTITYDTSCLPEGSYTFQAAAIHCGNTNLGSHSNAEAYDVEYQSHDDLTTERVGVDENSGESLVRVDVNYILPPNTNQWGVTIYPLPWFDSSGNLQSISSAGSGLSTRTGTWSHTFGIPANGPRQIKFVASVGSCKTYVVAHGAAETPNCCSTAPRGSANPVQFSDGNVSYTERDPLPVLGEGVALVRNYDNQDRVGGLFGVGWSSLLAQRLIETDIGPSPHTIHVVHFTTAEDSAVMFEKNGSAYEQRWPRPTAPATLTYDPSSAVYTYRAPNSRHLLRFRASDGRLVNISTVGSTRSVNIAWDSSGMPVSATDSWTGIAWNFTVDSTNHRVTEIGVSGRSDLVWQYNYDSSGRLTSVTPPGGGSWRTYEYDSSWGMTAVNDASGNLIESHDYDEHGRGISSTGPQDEIASIQYRVTASTAGDTITRVTMKTDAVVDYVLRPAGGSYQTVRIIGGCSSCGARDMIYVNDAEGRVMREQAPTGYIKQTAYTTGGLIASVQHPLRPSGCDPETSSTRCRLTENSLAAATLDTTSATTMTTYTYGDAYWPEKPTVITRTSALVPSGVVTEELTYDSSTGNVLAQQQLGWKGSTPAQETHTTTTTLYNGTEGAAFTPGGTFSASWLTLPQPQGLRKSVDGPRTDVTDVVQFVYYPIDSTVTAKLRGKLAATKNAAGHIVHFDNYDEFGNVLRTVDANGVANEATFDTLGRALTTTVKSVSGCSTTVDPLCATDLTTTRLYATGGGPLQRVTAADGSVTAYEYDSRGRVSAVMRGVTATDLRERMETDYDADTGKKSAERYLARVSSSWVEKREETFQYDNLAQLEAAVHGDATSVGYTYDVDGMALTTRDENHTTANMSYAYDPARRLATVTQTLSGASGGHITTGYTYDLHGNLHTVTDPNGNVTTYTYDDFQRMQQQVSPVTGTTTYAYDLGGNLTSTTDANGATTARTYDVLNRVLTTTSTRTGATTETVTWSYDDTTSGDFGIGHLATMTDPSGETISRYDRRGLLRSSEQTISGETYTTTFGYDENGNRSSLTDPSGTAVTYTFDYAGRPVTAATATDSIVTSAEYLPFGPLTSLAFGNGAVQTTQYNSRYLPTENKLATSTDTLAQYAYDEDAVGNITEIHDVTDSTYNRDFAYDDLNRLVTANSGSSLWGNGGYTYDAMGNMLTSSVGGRSVALSYSSTTPKVSQSVEDSITYGVTHDSAGNETEGQDIREYSTRNLLSNVTTNTQVRNCPNCPAYTVTHTDEYLYDGRGVRVEMDHDSFVSGQYIYTPELHLLARAYGSASITDTFVWFGGRPVAQLSPGTLVPIRYTFTDLLGTPIIQTDASANVVWRAEYEPFGHITAIRQSVDLTLDGPNRDEQPLRLPGQEFARLMPPGTEENYNIFRWYRAGWGRYTQADPIGLKGGIDLYDYAAGSPLIRLDALGLSNRTRRPSEMDCCELSRRIDDATNELEERYDFERRVQRDVTTGAISRSAFDSFDEYTRHRMRYDQLRQRLNELNDEYFDRCGPPGSRSRDWAARPFPGWGYVFDAYRRTVEDNFDRVMRFLAANPPSRIPGPLPGGGMVWAIP